MGPNSLWLRCWHKWEMICLDGGKERGGGMRREREGKEGEKEDGVK